MKSALKKYLHLRLGMLHIHPKVVDTFSEHSTAKAHRYISPTSLSQSRLTGS